MTDVHALSKWLLCYEKQTNKKTLYNGDDNIVITVLGNKKICMK